MNKKCRVHPSHGHKRHALLMICLFAFALTLFVSPVMAKPLYQEQVEQSEVSDKALKKSLKQVKEHKEIKVVDDLSVPPFHKRAVLQTTKKQPFCMTCHLSLPHRKNERSRTFMNMHSRYIACETCHFIPKGAALEYRWLAYDGVDAGKLIAPRRAVEVSVETPAKSERKHTAQFKKREPLAPQPGARISPFYNDVPVLLFKETPFAKDIEKKWEDADETQRAEIKAQLHAPLKKKGAACKECHGKRTPMIDFERLGASATQLKAIQNNIVARFFERFKKEDERIRIDKLL